MLFEGILNLQTVLILVVGFLAGMIPAMLFIGFYGGRQVEKQRKALQLKYERQVSALRATLRRMMNRIDGLTNERNLLIRTNKGLREAIRDQHKVSDQAVQELEESRERFLELKTQVETLTAENLRHEGRLQQAQKDQQYLTYQFQQSVSQFTEADRLRRHLLFATNQLRETQISNQALEARLGKPIMRDGTDDPNASPEQLDILVIQGIEPDTAEKLHDSGIHTIADLALQTPARVAHFAGLSGWNESADWIAEAKARIATAKRPLA